MPARLARDVEREATRKRRRLPDAPLHETHSMMDNQNTIRHVALVPKELPLSWFHELRPFAIVPAPPKFIGGAILEPIKHKVLDTSPRQFAPRSWKGKDIPLWLRHVLLCGWHRNARKVARVSLVLLLMGQRPLTMHAICGCSKAFK
eukprot:3736426-Pyramimonas_sp.AAC.1